MTRSEYKSKLAAYLIKRDEHLALNSTQALQLAHYVMLFGDKIGMLPPSYELEHFPGKTDNGWED